MLPIPLHPPAVPTFTGEPTQVGSVLRGASGAEAQSEFFGSSVAANSNRIVVVGASGNSGGSSFGRGAFYIYEYAGSDKALQRGVTGLHTGDSLGQAVGIDDESGYLVVVSAPGSDSGFVRIYEKVAGSWTSTFFDVGDEAGEGFGTSVKDLSLDLVAVGTPSYLGGRGRVVVLQRSGNIFERAGELVGQDLE